MGKFTEALELDDYSRIELRTHAENNSKRALCKKDCRGEGDQRFVTFAIRYPYFVFPLILLQRTIRQKFLSIRVLEKTVDVEKKRLTIGNKEESGISRSIRISAEAVK